MKRLNQGGFVLLSEAVLRGGQAGGTGLPPHGQNSAPLWSPLMKLVATWQGYIHNSCIHSVASRSWCQTTPVTQSCIRTSGILGPKYRCGHPAGHPKLLQLETPLFAVFCFVSFFWVVFSFCIVCMFNLSPVVYFPACSDVNGAV